MRAIAPAFLAGASFVFALAAALQRREVLSGYEQKRLSGLSLHELVFSSRHPTVLLFLLWAFVLSGVFCMVLAVMLGNDEG